MLKKTGPRRRRRRRDDLDPASGLANLADVILVFIVGLMLSVVIHYGVNLEAIREDSAGREKTYQIGGYIYTDPETGVKYLILD
jgi:hypothetical protein